MNLIYLTPKNDTSSVDTSSVNCCYAIFVALLLFAVVNPLVGATQVITLNEGWNAVHLEVEPDNPLPSALFNDQPIEMVALWLPSKARVNSLTDEAAIPEKSSEWSVWHPESHPAAFTNNLFQLQANRSLLIKATEATTITVEGAHAFKRQTWQAPSFNLVGLSVDPAAPPTFARYFAGSRAHAELKIFKMLDNRWVRVSPIETVKRGQAYWVWTKEGSDFQGPLDVSVSTDGRGRLPLSGSGQRAAVDLRVNGGLPFPLSLTAGGDLPILGVVGSGDAVALGSLSRLLDAGERLRVSLHLPTGASVVDGTSVLTIRGGGVLFELPLVTTADQQ